MIFWWFERTVQVVGKAERDTRCEFCLSLFRHTVSVVKERTAEGLLPASDERVEEMKEAAEKEMPDSLERHPGQTPCPHCYAYQTNMFPRMARKRYEWTIQAAGIAFFAAVMSFLACGVILSEKDVRDPSPYRELLFLIPVAFLLGGIGIVWARQRLLNRFDPNLFEPLWDRKYAARKATLLKLSATASPPAE